MPQISPAFAENGMWFDAHGNDLCLQSWPSHGVVNGPAAWSLLGITTTPQTLEGPSGNEKETPVGEISEGQYLELMGLLPTEEPRMEGERNEEGESITKFEREISLNTELSAPSNVNITVGQFQNHHTQEPNSNNARTNQPIRTRDEAESARRNTRAVSAPYSRSQNHPNGKTHRFPVDVEELADLLEKGLSVTKLFRYTIKRIEQEQEEREGNEEKNLRKGRKCHEHYVCHGTHRLSESGSWVGMWCESTLESKSIYQKHIKMVHLGIKGGESLSVREWLMARRYYPAPLPKDLKINDDLHIIHLKDGQNPIDALLDAMFPMPERENEMAGVGQP
jgi:hypothetical protein